MPDDETRIVVIEILDYFSNPEHLSKVDWEVEDDLAEILNRFKKDVIAEVKDSEEDEE
jgi:hypothetical protein